MILSCSAFLLLFAVENRSGFWHNCRFFGQENFTFQVTPGTSATTCFLLRCAVERGHLLIQPSSREPGLIYRGGCDILVVGRIPLSALLAGPPWDSELEVHAFADQRPFLEFFFFLEVSQGFVFLLGPQFSFGHTE